MKSYLLTTDESAGGDIMKKVAFTILKRAVWLMIVVLVLLLGQTPVYGGATNCVMPSGDRDADCDGFSDSEETSPNVIAGVQTDRTRSDLFVILDPSSVSLFPSNPLATLATSAASRGLTVRQISGPVSGVRNVTSFQKAVKVIASTYVGSYLGDSPQGNPDTIPDNGASVIYTQKITNTVAALCSPPGKTLTCKDAKDSTAITQPAVIANYVKHTIAHEVSHQMNLKYTCESSIGCHYPTITSASQAPSIMDQTVFYVKGTKGVTWYIGSAYNAADTNYQLRP